MQSKGQSLSEYGIIITLVALVGMAGLMLLGQGITGELTTLTASGSNAQASSSSLPPGMQDTASPTPAGNPGNNPSQSAKTGQTCLQDSICYTEPAPASSEQTVQTAGGNGSEITKALASRVSKMADVYASMPNPSPEVLEAIRKLANGAYLLSESQYGLEQDTAKDGYEHVGATAAKYNKKIWDEYTQAKSAMFTLNLLKEQGSWLNRKMDRFEYSQLTPELVAQIDDAYAQIEASGLEYYKYANFTATSSKKTGKVEANYLRSIEGTEKGEKADNTFLFNDPQSRTTNQNAGVVCDAGDSRCNRKTLPSP